MSEMAEARKTARAYPFSTSMLSWRPDTTAMRVFADSATYVEAADAANECEHGFLPGDTEPTGEDLKARWDECGCWNPGPIRTSTPAEARVSPAAPKVETPVETLPPKHVEQLAPGPVFIDLPPFIQQVVTELDGESQRLIDELERLAQVRAALTEAT